MHLLPVLFPGWFPGNGLEGTNTRELWLQVMGLVNFSIGAGWLSLEAVRYVSQLRLRFAQRARAGSMAAPVRSAA